MPSAALAQEVVQTVDLPHPIYIDSAEGPYLTDLDGNRYIDLTGGFGPNVLGNKPEPVEAMIGPQIEKGGIMVFQIVIKHDLLN